MNQLSSIPPLETVLGAAEAVAAGRLAGEGPAGALLLTAAMLRDPWGAALRVRRG